MAADYRIPSTEQDPSATKSDNENDEPLLAEERDNFTLRTKREIFNVNDSEKNTRKKYVIFYNHFWIENRIC